MFYCPLSLLVGESHHPLEVRDEFILSSRHTSIITTNLVHWYLFLRSAQA